MSQQSQQQQQYPEDLRYSSQLPPQHNQHLHQFQQQQQSQQQQQQQYHFQQQPHNQNYNLQNQQQFHLSQSHNQQQLQNSFREPQGFYGMPPAGRKGQQNPGKLYYIIFFFSIYLFSFFP